MLLFTTSNDITSSKQTVPITSYSLSDLQSGQVSNVLGPPLLRPQLETALNCNPKTLQACRCHSWRSGYTVHWQQLSVPV